MIRAFFLAVGIFICVVGAECLFVEKAVFASFIPPKLVATSSDAANARQPNRELALPDWAPYGLLAGGAVVIIYSFMIPRRLRA
ncbi:MAG: hypothetical protein VB835_15300 [Pirellulales bacterium]